MTNIRGIEIDPFAVQLARVTMWMGHKLAVDELDLEERVLPLVDLSGIRRGDALKLEWPRADAIIGNPPYHGDRRLRGELGDEYVEWLKTEFGIGVKDYCVYWFRKAHDRLESGGRAGLVGTNSISQNRARGASLQYIVDNGGVITSAVSTQDWSGEAAVDWVAPWTMASDATVAFAFQRDEELGVLSSATHRAWAQLLGSTLEDRIRYTPKTSFGTFPWPAGNLDEVASIARRLYSRRSEICLERQIGLTKLYNEVDDGAYRDLRELHAALDEAVAAAYGWPSSSAHDPRESNRRLLELNRAIAAGEIEYRPFG